MISKKEIINKYDEFKRQSLLTKVLFGFFLIFSMFLLVRFFYTIQFMISPIKLQYETNFILAYLDILFHKPLIAILIPILSIAIAYALAMHMNTNHSKKDDRGIRISDSNEEGSSHPMDNKEKKDFFKMISPDRLEKGYSDGIIIAQDKKTKELLTVPWEYDDPNKQPPNRNMCVFGYSGSRKSSSVLISQIYNSFRHQMSIVCTDPKGEMIQETYAAAKYYRYRIRILNLLPEQFKMSDGIDILKPLKESSDPQLTAEMVTNILINNTGTQGQSIPFWQDANTNCLKLALLYVTKSKHFYSLAQDDKARNIKTVYSLLTNTFPYGSANASKTMRDVIQAAIDYDMEDRKLLAQPFQIWSSHPQADSIQSGLAIRLSIFQSDTLCKILSEDEINFEELDDKNQPTIFYILCSDNDDTYKCILTLFSTFLFNSMYAIADKKNTKKLNRPLSIIYEEMANIGKIPNLSKLVSTLRSRGISMTFCYQTLGQLIDIYSDKIGSHYEWEAIIGNCFLYLSTGSRDQTTKKFLSDISGKMTIEKKAAAKDLPVFSPIRIAFTERLQNTKVGRPVYMPDEIDKIKATEIMIAPVRYNCTIEDKYFYKNHPDYRLRILSYDGTPVKYDHHNHLPAWRRVEEINNKRIKENTTESDAQILDKIYSSKEFAFNELKLKVVDYKEYEENRNLYKKDIEEDIYSDAKNSLHHAKGDAFSPAGYNSYDAFRKPPVYNDQYFEDIDQQQEAPLLKSEPDHSMAATEELSEEMYINREIQNTEEAELINHIDAVMEFSEESEEEEEKLQEEAENILFNNSFYD